MQEEGREVRKKDLGAFQPRTGFDLDIGAEDLGLSPSAKDEREGEQGDATAGSGKFGGGK